MNNDYLGNRGSYNFANSGAVSDLQSSAAEMMKQQEAAQASRSAALESASYSKNYWKDRAAEMMKQQQEAASNSTANRYGGLSSWQNLNEEVASSSNPYSSTVGSYNNYGSSATSSKNTTTSKSASDTKPSSVSTGGSVAKTSSSALKVDNDKVSQFVNKIEESIDSINSEWNNIIMTDINTINNSWASNDAKEYVDKLMAEGDKISDVVLALKLLANTYKKVMNEDSATQQEISNTIKNI